ncbi:ABC transporter permease subunit [candidate division KSB1 bacterium]|nr:ABC transporter permease subunit [candidate division KSB1 bacterium]
MIWQLLIKDLQRRKARPVGIIVWLALPLVLAFLVGLVSSGGSSSDQPQITVPLLVEDHDDSFVSQFLLGAFGRGELGELFSLTPVDSGRGRARMDAGKASALLIIPLGLGDSLLAGKSSTLILVKNPAQSFLPKIAEETVSILAEAGDRASRLLDSPLQEINHLNNRDNAPQDIDVARIAVQINRIIRRAEPVLLPPLVQVTEQTIKIKENQPTPSFSLFAYLLSGVVIMTLMFMLDNLAKDIFVEREQKTLFRLLTTPVTRRQFIAAKLLFMWLMAFLSLLLVWLFAIIAFNITPPSWLLFALLVVVTTGALSALAGLLYSFIATRTQASGIVPAFVLVFAMLGGAMIPLETLPGFIRQLAPFSPLYWAVYPWQRMMAFGDQNFGVILFLGVLAAFTLAGNGLTFIIINKRVRL